MRALFVSAGIPVRGSELRNKLVLRMDKKETILLDACLLSVIDNIAFDAELRNGHRFVAFFRRGEWGSQPPKVGAQVTVEMSPYDMSKGRLVIEQEQ